MERPLLLFAAAMLKRWWALLSCALFTVLGVYAAATNKGNAWVVGATAAAAVLLFIGAAYLTWKDEHIKYTDEIAKNQRPEIRGEVRVCGYGISSEGQTEGQWGIGCEVIFELSMCNHRPVTTTIHAIECDGSQLRPPVNFSTSSFRMLQQSPVGEELPYGIGKNLTVAIDAMIDGVRWGDVHPIDSKLLKSCIIDAFGQRHLLEVMPRNTLFPREAIGLYTKNSPMFIEKAHAKFEFRECPVDRRK